MWGQLWIRECTESAGGNLPVVRNQLAISVARETNELNPFEWFESDREHHRVREQYECSRTNYTERAKTGTKFILTCYRTTNSRRTRQPLPRFEKINKFSLTRLWARAEWIKKTTIEETRKFIVRVFNGERAKKWRHCWSIDKKIPAGTRFSWWRIGNTARICDATNPRERESFSLWTITTFVRTHALLNSWWYHCECEWNFMDYANLPTKRFIRINLQFEFL